MRTRATAISDEARHKPEMDSSRETVRILQRPCGEPPFGNGCSLLGDGAIEGDVRESPSLRLSPGSLLTSGLPSPRTGSLLGDSPVCWTVGSGTFPGSRRSRHPCNSRMDTKIKESVFVVFMAAVGFREVRTWYLTHFQSPCAHTGSARRIGIVHVCGEGNSPGSLPKPDNAAPQRLKIHSGVSSGDFSPESHRASRSPILLPSIAEGAGFLWRASGANLFS
jgi:hypothetical protein